MVKKQTEWSRAYNEKAYDRLAITIPKGRKADVEALAKQQGESVNGLVNRLLRAAAGLTEEEWKEAPVEPCEPIVPTELFDQAQEVLKKKEGQKDADH